jgi:hypothetical protein
MMTLGSEGIVSRSAATAMEHAHTGLHLSRCSNDASPIFRGAGQARGVDGIRERIGRGGTTSRSVPMCFVCLFQRHAKPDRHRR